MLLLDKDLKVLVDDGHGKQDSGSRSNSAYKQRRGIMRKQSEGQTQKISSYGQEPDTQTTKGGGSGNDPLQLLVHGLVTMSTHDKLLLLELLGNVARRTTANFNPSFRKHGARTKHKDDIHQKVQWIAHRFCQILGRRNIVGKPGRGKV